MRRYQCERCASKQNAEKGLRITHFPYLLTIQLKRFDFDYNSLHRVKLNDRMTFPDVLELNEFVHRAASPLAAEPNASPKMSYAGAAGKRGAVPKTIHEESEEQVSGDTPSTSASGSGEKSCWLHQGRDSEAVQQMLRRGKYVYELFRCR